MLNYEPCDGIVFTNIRRLKEIAINYECENDLKTT